MAPQISQELHRLDLPDVFTDIIQVNTTISIEVHVSLT